VRPPADARRYFRLKPSKSLGRPTGFDDTPNGQNRGRADATGLRHRRPFLQIPEASLGVTAGCSSGDIDRGRCGRRRCQLGEPEPIVAFPVPNAKLSRSVSDRVQRLVSRRTRCHSPLVRRRLTRLPLCCQRPISCFSLK
jgi:hypothetical protein